MNTKTPNNGFLTASIILVGLGFTGSSWAECLNPNPLNWNDKPLPDGSSLYTDVDGKLEGCPAGYDTGCFIDSKSSSCDFISEDIDENRVYVVINREIDTETGLPLYSTTCFEIDDLDIPGAEQSCAQVKITDFAASKGGQGSNACLYSFSNDAATFNAGFSGANFFGIYLCSDDVYELVAPPPKEPAKVAGCFIDGTSTSRTAVIHDIPVSCPADLEPGQTRTIVVSNDNISGFGFLNDNGEVDFNNICICIGGDLDDYLAFECNPYPEGYEHPDLVGLPKCTIDEGAEVPVNMMWQNPRCVTGAGDRRCY